ncbi:glucose-6-phosphate isomerase [Bauldia sp.]|uniref:glucose-6-phosphate isomerase n=1 Tax=Bauldia sp. TaxID=2575872 RepID=UPI003BA864EC
MSLREPKACVVDADIGVLEGGGSRYVKRLRDLEGLYADGAAFSALIQSDRDREVYEVTDCRPSTDSGDLIFGVTRMVPGRVGDEFFLTRGHIHANANRSEVYYGQKGHGVMLMESPAGETRTVEIRPGTVCYVPPFWIHRSINVGDEDLVMLFCFPADAGQDYEIIAGSGGMRHRVVAADTADGWTLVDNETYRPRGAAELARRNLPSAGPTAS